MKHVVLYVGHLYKLFWTKKNDRVGRRVREGQNIAKNGPRFWLWSPLEAPKSVKDPENGQKLFRGSPAKVTDMYSLFKTWMVALCIDQDAIFFRGSDSCSSSGSNLNNT